MKVVLITGGFDPVHQGHISYIRSAAELGDLLIVGLNSDAWLTRKKSQPFMPMVERRAVVSSIRWVDEVIEYDDSDDSSCAAISIVRSRYPDADIIFANGGDRGRSNTPELSMLQSDPKLSFVWSVGGDNKANSSSWILKEWKTPKTDRAWGYYRVLHQDERQVKVKELTVDPGKRLSLQKHSKRSEFWFVAHGQASVYTINCSSDIELMGVFGRFQNLWIQNGQWHQLVNDSDEPLRLIEIQYGENCIEDDIIRK
jgi:cytidyltransferase-like protein